MFSQTIFRFSFFLLLLCSYNLQAEEVKESDDHWYTYDHLYIQVGSYAHFSDSDDFMGTPIFTSLEAVKANDWLYGLALFNNSFDQFSQYFYAGKSWNYHGKWEGFHTKLTAGLIHGYKDEFEEKIPFNNYGLAPAIIPGVGYKKGRYGADMILLGTSAMLFTVGMDF